jgi:hypothetical protein
MQTSAENVGPIFLFALLFLSRTKSAVKYCRYSFTSVLAFRGRFLVNRELRAILDANLFPPIFEAKQFGVKVK